MKTALFLGYVLALMILAVTLQADSVREPAVGRSLTLRELPAELPREIDERIVAFRSKNPLPREKESSVREIVKLWVPSAPSRNMSRSKTLLSIGPAAIGAIAELLSSQDDVLRLKATESLSIFIVPKEQFTEDYKQHTQPLLVALTRRAIVDRTPSVRFAAALNLHRISFRQNPVPPGVGATLEDVYLRDPDPKVRDYVYGLMQSLGLVPRDPKYGVE